MGKTGRPAKLATATTALKAIAPSVLARAERSAAWDRGANKFERTEGKTSSYGFVELLVCDEISFAVWVEYSTVPGPRDIPALAAAFSAEGAAIRALRAIGREEQLRAKEYGLRHRDRPAGYDGEPIIELEDDDLVHLTRYLPAGNYAIRRAAATFSRFFEAWFERVEDAVRPPAATEGRLSFALRAHRHRERRLRNEKLAQFKKRHAGRLFCEVRGCGFEFAAVYGVAFAEVHHTKPLASRRHGTPTRLEDLIVVCSNCHAMIHATRVAKRPQTLISPHRRRRTEGT